MELLEHGVNMVGVDNGEDALNQRWPGMGAIVRVAGMGATPHHIVKCCETATTTLVKHLHYSLVIGLVKGYKYCFHFDCTKLNGG